MPCGTLAIAGAGRTLPLRLEGAVSDLDSARPLRARGCGRLALPARRTLLTASAGPARLDFLRLASPAPAGAAPTPAGGGRVLDAGQPRRGVRDGVRLAVDGPSWLVLGQSFNRGWRAWCGDRSLGAPRPIDGHANGWRIDRECRDARFAFAPNRWAAAGYAISALAALGLLAVVLRGRRRGSATASAAPATQDGEDGDGAPRWPPRRAIGAGLLVAAAVGFVFALRAGAVAGPVVALALWRGVPTPRLALVAGALVGVVVPGLHLAFPAADRGGFNFEYATEQMAAHWVAVAAIVLMAIALARELARTRRAGRWNRSSSTATPRSPAGARGLGRRRGGRP
jgi:hypothetical protein